MLVLERGAVLAHEAAVIIASSDQGHISLLGASVDACPPQGLTEDVHAFDPSCLALVGEHA